MVFISKWISAKRYAPIDIYFYSNYAVHLHSRSTVIAGTAGQSYVDNIFFNPNNDYEMITVNKSL